MLIDTVVDPEANEGSDLVRDLEPTCAWASGRNLRGSEPSQMLYLPVRAPLIPGGEASEMNVGMIAVAPPAPKPVNTRPASVVSNQHDVVKTIRVANVRGCGIPRKHPDPAGGCGKDQPATVAVLQDPPGRQWEEG